MPEIVATTLDPNGRRVILTKERWEHIKNRHALLAPKLREIMGTVREPHLSMRGQAENEV